MAGQYPKLTGIDADRAELSAGGGNGIGHTGRDVIGIHQQRGTGSQRFDLGAECGSLG
ncbi:Uncharacterised protein [Mycobacterium tuberculosis]|uniref:Uncharacterized protein n=1 Tax=Mycobacterium tuberculosis TaxID=1773 RepID=A0A0U0T9L3_MYCTX|nr:Uncharacterised protein [Mycobacterium tuberculosis]COW59244.1 Uncharacterised protein [Mycobacterium tuberculosis]COX39658.1 Uncharacterised protein [Mycobacterium tuberculosis]COZ64507.1 Uncharacterised protein [Mycobacterium tuberculosis]